MKQAEAPTPTAGNPFLAPEGSPAPQPRARKAKPPPAIVSAGGVDMARAHASNIKLGVPNKRGPTISPKVVIGVETNPRRAPTMPRMNVGRSDAPPAPSDAPPPAGADGSPWARAGAAAELDKSALPSASMPHDETPEPARKKTRGAGWIGIAAIVVFILLAAGVIRRVRMHYQAREEAAATPTVATEAPTAATPSVTATAEPEPSASVTAEAEPPEIEPAESATALAPPPTTTARTSPAPKTTATVKGTSKPTAAPPPPKPVFTPPFELPEEKSK